MPVHTYCDCRLKSLKLHIVGQGTSKNINQESGAYILNKFDKVWKENKHKLTERDEKDVRRIANRMCKDSNNNNTCCVVL